MFINLFIDALHWIHFHTMLSTTLSLYLCLLIFLQCTPQLPCSKYEYFLVTASQMASWKACFFAHCLNTVGTDLLPAKQAANRKMAFTGPWFSHSLRLYTMKNSALLRFCGHPWECDASISFCPKKRTLQWRLSETGWDTLLLLLPNLQVRLELTSAANTIRSVTRLGSVEVENYLGFNSLSDTLSYSCFICLVWNAESVAVINGCTDLMIWWWHILFFFFKKKKSKVVYSVENEMKQFASEFAHGAFPSAKSMFLSPTGGTLAHPCCPLSPLSQLSKTFPSIPFFYFRLCFFPFFLRFTSIFSVQYSPEYPSLSFPLTVSCLHFLLTVTQVQTLTEKSGGRLVFFFFA